MAKLKLKYVPHIVPQVPMFDVDGTELKAGDIVYWICMDDDAKWYEGGKAEVLGSVGCMNGGEMTAVHINTKILTSMDGYWPRSGGMVHPACDVRKIVS